MQARTLEGGFADAPVQSAMAFRNIMRALACPGDILEINGATPPAPLSPAAGIVLLTLCDPDTPVYLGAGHDTDAVRGWIAFHTGAPVTTAPKAAFALGTWGDLPLGEFATGTPEYPDRAATLIVEMPALSQTGATLRGPGIKSTAMLSLPEITAFQTNAALFPLGLDFFFTCGNRLAGLPRSTKVS